MGKKQKTSHFNDEQVRREIVEKAMATASSVLTMLSILGDIDIADKINKLIQDTPELGIFLYYYSDACRMEGRKEMLSHQKPRPSDSEDDSGSPANIRV